MKSAHFCAIVRGLERGNRAIRQAVAPAALLIGLALSVAECSAGFRGAFDPLTPDSRLINRYETSSLRPIPAEDGIERYFTFTTRNSTPGRETSREIWLHRNVARAGINLESLAAARVPLFRDPTGLVSYLDPAWSPDGRYLAYVQSSYNGLNPAIYVQEFSISDDIATAATPVGAPILVVPTGSSQPRSPNWSPDGGSMAFQSAASGKSYDIYTVQVFPTIGTPVRCTFDDWAAEQHPAWSPDGTRIAYETNYLGPEVIAIVDLTTPSPYTTSLAEPLCAPVYHRRPSWSSDGGSIYYHAPKNEDGEQNPDIWKLDLATQSKCAISIDLASDSDVNVSRYLHTSPDGIPFNYFLFTSMATGSTFPGPNIWRGEFIYNCIPALQMGVVLQPRTLQLGSDGNLVTASLSFPAKTQAAGYQCASYDGPLEGVKLRNTVIVSPAIEDIAAQPDPATGGVFPVFTDKVQSGVPYINVTWNRRDITAFLIEKNLVGRDVPLRVEAYSNGVGRRFRGYAYIKLNADPAATGALVITSSTPNPFNPHTDIRFTTGADGNVAVRIFNARGALVKVLADRSFPRGGNSVSWDGRDSRGNDVPSGIYFAVAQAAGGVQDRYKLVLLR